MQTPEEFAVAVTEHCPEVSDGMCFHSAPVGRCIDLKAAADLIAARDEAIRADERAKVLAGFEWDERARAASPYSRVEIQRALDTGTWIRERRLIGPWEPIEEDA